MKELPLSQGRAFTLVDDDVFEFAIRWKWKLLGAGYAGRGTGNPGTYKAIYLHRVIMDAAPGEEVDHINGNKLDNRRCNLRLCSHAENHRNKPPQGSKRYKGMYQDKRTGRWQSRIKVNGRFIALGGYATPQEAAVAYNEAALAYFGEFACLNVIGDTHDET